MSSNFKGLNGEAVLIENNIIIKRNGSIEQIFHNKCVKKIPIERINIIHYKKGSLINGYICFVTEDVLIPQNIIEALKNDNVIVFRMNKNKEALLFKMKVEKLMNYFNYTDSKKYKCVDDAVSQINSVGWKSK